MRSEATTVADYLDELDVGTAAVISAVRDTVNEHIDAGFNEQMDWGMISWVVPLERYPTTYNKKPLLYCSLAAQKRHNALYLMNAYADSPYLDLLEEGYRAAGLKLAMGKSCIRFRDLASIDLPTVAQVIAACDVEAWIRCYETARQRGNC